MAPHQSAHLTGTTLQRRRASKGTTPDFLALTLIPSSATSAITAPGAEGVASVASDAGARSCPDRRSTPRAAGPRPLLGLFRRRRTVARCPLRHRRRVAPSARQDAPAVAPAAPARA